MRDLDFSSLDAHIAKLRALPNLVPQAAREIADELEAEIGKTINAGQDAYGNRWRETQDGDRPLQQAAKAVRFGVVGKRVICRVVGPEARHHLGWARGGVVRAIIPTSSIPDAWLERIRAVLGKVFEAQT